MIGFVIASLPAGEEGSRRRRSNLV